MQTIYFGGGCFWCIETTMRRLKGVESAISGYTGGTTKNPSYEEVCSGTTGHVEVVKVEFDPDIISFDTLLSVFFSVHDPTQINRQGNDVGVQYRSVIFYTSAEQRDQVQAFIKNLEQENLFPEKIVTSVEPLTVFYQAEDYHQDYYNQNPGQSYCNAVIKKPPPRYYYIIFFLIKAGISSSSSSSDFF
jgi:peptide-methionine (S)-S-oxide reductase